ncbi:MAG: autotransporter domain-containing protein, partial [Magnetococcales bacterium]|nr:autotransporter domain-containing protein [Magnetococcales bacterium]
GVLTLTDGVAGLAGTAGAGGVGAIGAGGKVTATVAGNVSITGGVVGTGTVNLAAGSNLTATYASAADLGALTGSGNFIKAGAGILTLTGDSSSFTGTVNLANVGDGGFIIKAGAVVGGIWSTAASGALNLAGDTRFITSQTFPSLTIATGDTVTAKPYGAVLPLFQVNGTVNGGSTSTRGGTLVLSGGDAVANAAGGALTLANLVGNTLLTTLTLQGGEGAAATVAGAGGAGGALTAATFGGTTQATTVNLRTGSGGAGMNGVALAGGAGGAIAASTFQGLVTGAVVLNTGSGAMGGDGGAGTGGAGGAGGAITLSDMVAGIAGTLNIHTGAGAGGGTGIITSAGGAGGAGGAVTATVRSVTSNVTATTGKGAAGAVSGAAAGGAGGAGGAITLNVANTIGGNIQVTTGAGDVGGSGATTGAGGAGGAGGAFTMISTGGVTGGIALNTGSGAAGGNAGATVGGAGGAGGAISLNVSPAVSSTIGGNLVATAGAGASGGVGSNSANVAGGAGGAGGAITIVLADAIAGNVTLTGGQGGKGGNAGTVGTGGAGGAGGAVTAAIGNIGGVLTLTDGVAGLAGTAGAGGVGAIGAGGKVTATVAGNVSITGGVVGTGTVNLAAGSNLTATYASASTLGALTGSGTFTKVGAGILTLTGDSSAFTGTITLANSSAGGVVMSRSGGTWQSSVSSSNGINSIVATYGAGSYSLASINESQIFSKAGVGELTITGNFTNTAVTNVTGGTLILNGTANTSNTVTVNNGATLVIGDATSTNSSITAPINIDSGGSLKGKGAIVGNVAMAGSIKPGNSIGTLAVTGNYTQAPGSIYEVEFDPTNAGLSDLITVTGVATLGGTVSAIKLPVAALSNWANRYAILTAGSITGNFVSSALSPADATLTTHLMYGPNKVDMIVTRGLNTQAMTENQMAVAVAIENSLNVGTQYSVIGSGVDALYNLSAIQVPDALGKAAGAVHSNAMSAEQDTYRVIERAISDHLFHHQNQTLASTVSGLNGGDVVGKSTSVWVRGVGQRGTGKADGNSAGYSQNMSGLLGGLDFKIARQAIMGISVGYSGGNLSGDDDSHLDLTSFHTTAYGRLDVDNFFFNGHIGFAKNRYESRRNTLGGTATGQSDGTDLFGGVDVGYHLDIGKNTAIEPRVGFGFNHIQQDGMKENGAGNLNLEVNEKTLNSTHSTVGFRAIHTVKKLDLSYEPELRMRWDHDFGDNTTETTANIAGQSFQTKGVARGRDAIVGGVGLTVVTKDDLKVSAGYDYESREKSGSHNLMLTITQSF